MNQSGVCVCIYIYIYLLASVTLQDVLILNSSDPFVQTGVLALEESVLDQDQVENLIKFCPTKEEMEMLRV